MFVCLAGIQHARAQTLSAGAGYVLPLASRMQSYDQPRVLTFANQENETISVGKITQSVNLSRSYFSGHIRYDSKNRFFGTLAVSGFIQRNTLEYKAVARYKDPNLGYNTITRIDNTPIIQDFSFLNLHVMAGTRLTHKHIVQPYVSGGAVLRRMLYHRFGNGFRSVQGREVRNELVYQNMNTLKPWMLCASAQLGVRFYDLRIETFYETSIAAPEKNSPAYYRRFLNTGIALSYDFFLHQLVSRP